MDLPPRQLTRRRLLALGAGTAAAAAVGGVLVGRDRREESTARIDPRGVYDPYRAGERLPVGYWPVYGRDFIRPIYDPAFIGADEIGWPDDADVIGVEVGGDARAYPVRYLTGRELVIDEVGGVPLLVSW